jgi:hypothetical protein
VDEELDESSDLQRGDNADLSLHEVEPRRQFVDRAVGALVEPFDRLVEIGLARHPLAECGIDRLGGCYCRLLAEAAFIVQRPRQFQDTMTAVARLNWPAASLCGR